MSPHKNRFIKSSTQCGGMCNFGLNESPLAKSDGKHNDGGSRCTGEVCNR